VENNNDAIGNLTIEDTTGSIQSKEDRASLTLSKDPSAGVLSIYALNQVTQ
jgi:hypothetical protein